MTLLYFLWGLLPAVLWFFVIKAWFQRVSKRPFQEDQKHFFSQAIFCSAALAVTIIVDRTLYDSLVNMLTLGLIDLSLFRWLLYPAILALLATIQSMIFPEKKPRLRPKSPFVQH